MKLSTLKLAVAQDDTPYTFPVLDPNGDPYENVTWSVVGSQSKARRAAEDAESRRLLRAGRAELEPEDIRARRINLALACSTGYTGWQDEDGGDVAFNKHNARMFLEADERILAQVERAIERHSAFLSKPSPSSTPT